jgi:hypothetical protein
MISSDNFDLTPKIGDRNNTAHGEECILQLEQHMYHRKQAKRNQVMHIAAREHMQWNFSAVKTQPYHTSNLTMILSVLDLSLSSSSPQLASSCTDTLTVFTIFPSTGPFLLLRSSSSLSALTQNVFPTSLLLPFPNSPSSQLSNSNASPLPTPLLNLDIAVPCTNPFLFDTAC